MRIFERDPNVMRFLDDACTAYSLNGRDKICLIFGGRRFTLPDVRDHIRYETALGDVFYYQIAGIYDLCIASRR